MEKMKNIPVAALLDVGRKYSRREKDDMLDAADRLLIVGRRSKDRHRNRKRDEKPQRKTYRPWLIWAGPKKIPKRSPIS